MLFLALSGVRIHDSALLALGLTLPAFSERGKTIAELPSLGLLTLAGLTPSNWAMEYKELDQIAENAVIELTETQHSVIVLSALTARILDAYSLADELRRAGKIVILGGLHVTAFPTEATNHADAIVIGEAEGIWPQLVEDIENGRLQKSYHAHQNFDFSAAPPPRYDLLNVADYNRMSLQTTRGCPLDCEFCGASRMISRPKRKPLALIRRDIECILTRWPKPFLELADDNTFVNREWSRQLLHLFAEYNFRWFTETDISVADDERLLDALAESGCAQLLIGFESASSNSLSQTDSRGWKERRFENYLKDIRRIQQRGISVNGCFTVGLDGDTEEVFQLTRDFVASSQLSHVQVTLLTPFPGTPLYRRFENTGRMLPGKSWYDFTLFDVVYQPTHMTPEQLREGFHWLVSELYHPQAVLQRTTNFRHELRSIIAQRQKDKHE